MKLSSLNGDRVQQRVSRGVVVMGLDGRIRCAGSLAVHWLRKYFPHADISERLPRRIDRWLSGKRSRTNSLAIEKNGTRLIVALVAGGPDEPPCLLLEEFAARERNGNTSTLTKREAEVLSWVTKGKANWAIGKILGLSPATVRKHLQNIYSKLGVENRTAAAICAVEILQWVGEDSSSFF